MPVQMELARIIISEINDQQIIYLKEVDGDRAFPILIGIFEATSIDRRVKGYESPRPLTHDLLVSVAENLGAEFQDVVISELKDHTYFARLRVRHNGELIEIDARPSDAIAVAVDILDEDHSLGLAMRRLASDPDLRRQLGERGRRYWESGRTVRHMVDGMDRAIRLAANLPAPERPLPEPLRPDPFGLARRLAAPCGVSVLDALAELSRPRPSSALEPPR